MRFGNSAHYFRPNHGHCLRNALFCAAFDRILARDHAEMFFGAGVAREILRACCRDSKVTTRDNLCLPARSLSFCDTNSR